MILSSPTENEKKSKTILKLRCYQCKIKKYIRFAMFNKFLENNIFFSISNNIKIFNFYCSIASFKILPCFVLEFPDQ